MSDMGITPSRAPEGPAEAAPDPAGPTTVVSVVVPTSNAAKELPELLRRIHGSLPRVDLILVDDASPDGTAAVARELGKTLPLRLLERKDEQGLSTAVLRGLQEARSDLCVVLAADLRHPPESIPRMVKAVTDGADIAVGSRYVRGGHTWNSSVSRRFASWAGTLLARPLTTVRDPMSGFFCLRRSLLAGVTLRPRGSRILLEILARTGTRKTVEIPIRFEDRSTGAGTFGPRLRRETLEQIRDLYRDLNPWPWKTLKFLCTGAIGVLPFMAVLNLVVRMGGSPDAGTASGWIVAMSTNYLLNRAWTFRAKGIPVVLSYLKYALGTLGGLGVQVAVIHTLPSWNVNLSSLLGIMAGTIFNFLASQLWAFARK